MFELKNIEQIVLKNCLFTGWTNRENVLVAVEVTFLDSATDAERIICVTFRLSVGMPVHDILQTLLLHGFQLEKFTSRPHCAIVRARLYKRS